MSLESSAEIEKSNSNSNTGAPTSSRSLEEVSAPQAANLSKNDHWVISFDSEQVNTTDSLGSKGARLAELKQAGFRIPEGFCITVSAFKTFCEFNKISLELQDVASLPNAIFSGKFSSELKQNIFSALNSVASKEYAVRSSSQAEDGSEHSMAGQFDSFLEVSPEDVLDKIKEIWAGMFNSRVLAYVGDDLDVNRLAMGVVVQRQISAEYAGVLFTLDPRTRSTDHLVIEWVEGLGEKLVSGEVTPERIFVNRAAPVMPDHLRKHLSSSLKQLVDEALKIESFYQHPQDIEFCIDKDGLWLVQARPITALNSEFSTVWTNVNMNENFPRPLSPFTFSIVERFYTYYISNILRMFGWRQKDLYEARSIVDNLTGIQGGRVYYNLNNWYEVLHFFPIGGYLQKFLDNYIGQNIPFKFEPSEQGRQIARKARNPIRQLATYSKLLLIHLRSQYHLNRFEQKFYEHKRRWRRKTYQSLSLPELCEKIEDVFAGFVDHYYYSQGIADILVLIFPGSLKLLIKKWILNNEGDPDPIASELLSGMEVKSTMPSKAIQQLAEMIYSDPHLQTLLDEKNYEKLEADLPQSLAEIFDSFMSQFGARCYHECMIVYPTFEERTDLFWDLVTKYQSLPQKNNVDHQRSRATVKREVFKKLSYWKRPIFSFVLKHARKAIALREQGRIIRSLLFGEVRLITIAIGEKFKKLGYLNEVEDIFFLKRNEIEDIVNGKYPLIETLGFLIQQRKSELARCEEFEPPSFFLLEEGRYYSHSTKNETDLGKDAGKQLAGIPVSSGVVRAKVRIILDPIDDNPLQAGEILVTRTTDPGWTPLFMVAGGLILERGGLLSHGAIVAREFGIPAVVGVEQACKKLNDGEIVTLNASTGEISREP